MIKQRKESNYTYYWFISFNERSFNFLFLLLLFLLFFYPALQHSPGEIKRRERSWTPKKKLAQKRSRARRWWWAIYREMDLFCFSFFFSPTAELWSLRNAGRTLP